MKYPDFWGAFLNGMPLGTLFAGFLFSLIGIVLWSLIKSGDKDPSKKTFWANDLKRFVTSFLTSAIITFFTIRFFKQITNASSELLMGYCVIVGMTIDILVLKIRKWREAVAKKIEAIEAFGDKKSDAQG